MISNPKIGRVVQVWYAKPQAEAMPHHGRIGIITVVSKARKARNHMVRFGPGQDDVAAVPAGNLRDPPNSSLAMQFVISMAKVSPVFDAHWKSTDDQGGCRMSMGSISIERSG